MNVVDIKQGRNEAGIVPVHYKVLVKVQDDKKNEHGEHVTDSGFILPQSLTEKEEMAKVDAIVIDVGGNCFEDWDGYKPVPGDTVIIAKFAGMLCEGADGKEYRLITDQDIAAKRVKL